MAPTNISVHPNPEVTESRQSATKLDKKAMKRLETASTAIEKEMLQEG